MDKIATAIIAIQACESAVAIYILLCERMVCHSQQCSSTPLSEPWAFYNTLYVS